MTRAQSVLAGMAFVTVMAARTAMAQEKATAQEAAQEVKPPAAESGQTLSLDRVRAGLRQELYVDTRTQEPTFRTEVVGHVITLKNYWIDDSTAVGTYVHPTMSQGHGEYLNMLGSPVGATGRGPFARVNDPKQVIQVPMMMVDVTSLMTLGRATARQVRGAARERQRRGVKAQIRRELEEIDAAKAKPPAAAGAGTRQP
jgi:hypothetical protein